MYYIDLQQSSAKPNNCKHQLYGLMDLKGGASRDLVSLFSKFSSRKKWKFGYYISSQMYFLFQTAYSCKDLEEHRFKSDKGNSAHNLRWKRNF